MLYSQTQIKLLRIHHDFCRHFNSTVQRSKVLYTQTQISTHNVMQQFCIFCNRTLQFISPKSTCHNVRVFYTTTKNCRDVAGVLKPQLLSQHERINPSHRLHTQCQPYSLTTLLLPVFICTHFGVLSARHHRACCAVCAPIDYGRW